jgi:hypothetical protein
MEKLDEFKQTHGIRQGDPISPYLFLLAAEGLSCLLKHRSQSSVLSGIKVAPSAPSVNHLLFAYDSLLFFKATSGGAMDIVSSLEVYCQASGQKINRSKSLLFSAKVAPKPMRSSWNWRLIMRPYHISILVCYLMLVNRRMAFLNICGTECGKKFKGGLRDFVYRRKRGTN